MHYKECVSSEQTIRTKVMKVFYRISDGGNGWKVKFPFATKQHCLENFLKHFPKEEVILCADNVRETTHQWLSTLGCSSIWRTSYGNAYGFKKILQKALEYPDTEVIYFVEDDYLHRENSYTVLLEGLERADYVSLYDHIDKYMLPANGGNPLIGDDAAEETRVFLTKSTHWKLTNSTTMTFASTVNILREDYDIFDKNTNGTISQDFQSFLDLRARGRSLATPIPGYSTHCEVMWAAPLIDWSTV